MAGLEINHILDTGIKKLNNHFKDLRPKRVYKYAIDKKKNLIDDPKLTTEELNKYIVGEFEGMPVPKVMQYLIYFTIIIDEYIDPEDDTKVQRTISYRRIYEVPKNIYNNDSYKLELVLEFLHEAMLVHQVNAYNIAMTELAKVKAEKEVSEQSEEKVEVI